MPRIAAEMAEVSSLIGDVSRANILAALMDGRALTALELSLAARVTPQTTSSHCQIAPNSAPRLARKNAPSDVAETGGAEPQIAEQSRSWRAAIGEREVMRGS